MHDLTLNSDALRDAENVLFHRWQASRPGEAFLTDGAMPEFAEQQFRLLFVLKEGNDPDGIWSATGDLRTAWDWEHNDKHSRVWKMLARFAAIVIGGRDPKAVVGHWDDDVKAFLAKVACLNLKKKPGGSTAVYSEIERAALEDQQFIREQIALYKPALTICCGIGVFPAIEAIYGVAIDHQYDLAYADGSGTQHFLKTPALGVAMDFWHPVDRVVELPLLHKLADNVAHLRENGILG